MHLAKVLGALLIFFFGLKVFAAVEGLGIGVSFGSPALLGVRGTYQFAHLPWTLQGEYSGQVLHRNRGNGFLNSYRLDLQVECLGYEPFRPFYFAGADYFSGYSNAWSPTVHVVMLDAGLGLKVPIKQHWSMNAEIGGMVPTKAVDGFAFVGIVANLAVHWYWGSFARNDLD